MKALAFSIRLAYEVVPASKRPARLLRWPLACNRPPAAFPPPAQTSIDSAFSALVHAAVLTAFIAAGRPIQASTFSVIQAPANIAAKPSMEPTGGAGGPRGPGPAGRPGRS